MIDKQHPMQLSITHEQCLQSAQQQCCEMSVPLPQSLVFSTEQLSLVVSKDDDDTTETIDAMCQIIDDWPDNSIKWLKLTYQYCHQPRLYLNITDNYSCKDGANALNLSVANNRLEILDENNQAILSLDANDLMTGRNTILPLKNCLLQRGIWSISNILEKTAKLTKLVCQKTLASKLFEVSKVTRLCLGL
ncbi:MAG: hypothetical protein ACI9LX_002168 [Paraglaciecola sp.]|jgi:hypothetical protein